MHVGAAGLRNDSVYACNGVSFSIRTLTDSLALFLGIECCNVICRFGYASLKAFALLGKVKALSRVAIGAVFCGDLRFSAQKSRW